jgi:hypothetical protein
VHRCDIDYRREKTFARRPTVRERTRFVLNREESFWQRHRFAVLAAAAAGWVFVITAAYLVTRPRALRTVSKLTVGALPVT